jgi:hypothetical protein
MAIMMREMGLMSMRVEVVKKERMVKVDGNAAFLTTLYP